MSEKTNQKILIDPIESQKAWDAITDAVKPLSEIQIEKKAILKVIEVYRDKIYNASKIDGMAQIEALERMVKDFNRRHPKTKTDDLSAALTEIKKTFIKL